MTCALARRHNRQRFGRGEDGLVSSSCVIRMAMGDQRPVQLGDRIDIEVTHRAIEAVMRWMQKVFRSHIAAHSGIGVQGQGHGFEISTSV